MINVRRSPEAEEILRKYMVPAEHLIDICMGNFGTKSGFIGYVDTGMPLSDIVEIGIYIGEVCSSREIWYFRFGNAGECELYWAKSEKKLLEFLELNFGDEEF